MIKLDNIHFVFVNKNHCLLEVSQKLNDFPTWLPNIQPHTRHTRLNFQCMGFWMYFQWAIHIHFHSFGIDRLWRSGIEENSIEWKHLLPFHWFDRWWLCKIWMMSREQVRNSSDPVRGILLWWGLFLVQKQWFVSFIVLNFTQDGQYILCEFNGSSKLFNRVMS